MDTKKSAKLPDGVGRKIIEALKKQSQPTNDIQIEEQSSINEYNNHLQDFNSTEDSASYHNESEDLLWTNDDQNQLYDSNTPKSDFNDFVLDSDEENFNSNNHEHHYQYNEESNLPQQEANSEYYELYDDNQFSIDDEEEPAYEEHTPTQKTSSKPSFRKNEILQKSKINKSYVEANFELPDQRQQELGSGANIDILMRLISRLPSGVTRQTGAQIIRQTMEAMGISMSKVLTEAQQLQETLAQSTRDNINTIEEYRNNIRSLEKEVQNYKKQSEELEDLISLFISSDKKR